MIISRFGQLGLLVSALFRGMRRIHINNVVNFVVQRAGEYCEELSHALGRCFQAEYLCLWTHHAHVHVVVVLQEYD
jgi:hypothetical protein